jgi:hypothetical protein
VDAWNNPSIEPDQSIVAKNLNVYSQCHISSTRTHLQTPYHRLLLLGQTVHFEADDETSQEQLPGMSRSQIFQWVLGRSAFK